MARVIHRPPAPDLFTFGGAQAPALSSCWLARGTRRLPAASFPPDAPRVVSTPCSSHTPCAPPSTPRWVHLIQGGCLGPNVLNKSSDNNGNTNKNCGFAQETKAAYDAAMADIITNVVAIGRYVEEMAPEAQILLMALLPRGLGFRSGRVKFEQPSM